MLTNILLRRLGLQPPDPNTIGKLRLPSFCIYKIIGGLLWADFELKLIQTMSLCVVVVIFNMLKTPQYRGTTDTWMMNEDIDWDSYPELGQS
jgi:hypothetical protein